MQLVHETTVEFARENLLTVRGDCVACVAFQTVNVTGNCRGGVQIKLIVLPPPWRRRLHTVTIRCERACNAAEGSVARRSMFCDDRTIAIGCDKAARDIPRSIREYLADNFAKVYVLVKCVDISG